LLEDLDLDACLDREQYRKVFPPLRESLRRLQYQLRDAEIPTIVVFEGWGASGKGEVIQRLAEGLDPRLFRAYPETPPSELEGRHHWLWRYQTRLPEDGQMTLFDHAWYGRVLHDRVDKLVKKSVWSIAYDQINQFERWLVDDGQLVLKFFFHVGKREQRQRLRRMRKDPLESWKVDEDDARQNRRYGRWTRAIEDMLSFTDTKRCPWTLVPATDERAMRVQVFATLVARMTEALARREAAPASVSRTRAAADATGRERRKAAEESLARVRAVAREAGLPLARGPRPRKAKASE
jgi:polyphosphate kinase 2 (PPK2 family)